MLTKRRQDFLFGLYSEFTDFRVNGYNRDDAWYAVMDAHPELDAEERNYVLGLAKVWERDNGRDYNYRNTSPDNTIIKPISPPKQAPPQRIANQGLTGQLDLSRVRDEDRAALERTLDHLDSIYDEPPISEESTKPFNPVREENHPPNYFGKSSQFLLHIEGFNKPLVVPFSGDNEVIIGRTTLNTVMAPDVDLSVVRGEQMGVSRMHAAMKFENDQILITDIGSANHTYINGKRVFPDEIRVLHDGDEVWFGRLRCKVQYQHVG